MAQRVSDEAVERISKLHAPESFPDGVSAERRDLALDLRDARRELESAVATLIEEIDEALGLGLWPDSTNDGGRADLRDVIASYINTVEVLSRMNTAAIVARDEWRARAEAAEVKAWVYDAITEGQLEVEPNGFPPTEWWVKRPEPGCIHGCGDTLGDAVSDAIRAAGGRDDG